MARGRVDNTATARASAARGPDPSATASATLDLTTPIPAQPRLALTKTARLDGDDGDGLADAGEVIRYGFTVTNTGAVPVTQLRISDPFLLLAGTDVTCPSTALAPGAEAACTAAYRVTAADVARGTPIVNTATAGARGPEAYVESPPARTSTPVATPAAEPGLSLTKSARLTTDSGQPGVADAGDEITYTITVTNSGGTPLSAVRVADPRLPELACPQQTLAAGASMGCTAPPYRVTAADVTAGAVVNTATASANADGRTLTARDTATVPAASAPGPAPTPSPSGTAPPGTTPPGGRLPFTGAGVAGIAGIGLALLLTGALLAARARRRRG